MDAAVADGTNQIHNEATATANDPSDEPVDPSTDDEDTPVDDTAELEMVKSSELSLDADGDGLADADDQITYSFKVTNTGAVTIDNISIDDDLLAEAGVAVTCDPTTLAPGESVVCESAPFTVTQEDVDDAVANNNSLITNVATAKGEAPGGDPDDPSDDVETPEDSTDTPVDESAELELDKSISEIKDLDGNGSDLGDKIIYAFEITNTGAVTVSDITVDDQMLADAGVAITCDPTTLAPGESVTCYSDEYTITQTDSDAGIVENTATANGTDPKGDDVESNEDDEDEPLQQNGSLMLKKTSSLNDSDGDDLADAGETITYGFVLTNDGNVTMSDLTITDEMLGLTDMPVNADNCELDPADFDGTLAAGESVTCTLIEDYTVTQADVDEAFGNGTNQIHNEAVAKGTSPDPDNPNPETPPADTDTPVDDDPEMDLVKTAGEPVDVDGDGFTDAGDTIVFTFEVTNTGGVTIDNVVVNDPMLAELGIDITCDVTTIAPGEVATCTSGEYTITEDDVAAGNVHNVATATGTTPPDPENPDEPGEPVVTPPSETDTPTDLVPSISLVKSVEDASGNGTGEVGEELTYTFTVTNTGNVELSPVTITDEKLGLVDAACVDTLAVGETAVCETTGSYTVTAADEAAGGVHNAATASGIVPGSDEPVTSDSEVDITVPSNPVERVLAHTGANAVLLAGAGVLLLGGLGSFFLLFLRRRKEEEETSQA